MQLLLYVEGGQHTIRTPHVLDAWMWMSTRSLTVRHPPSHHHPLRRSTEMGVGVQFSKPFKKLGYHGR